MKQEIIYLDNASTSFPKPESVYAAVENAMRERCGNPGRSGHKLSLSAGRVIDETRVLCKRLFNAEAPENIIFTNNTTTAINIAIKGVINPGDHILTSSLEHNSVSRPLNYLENTGIEIGKLPADLNCGLNVDDIKKAQRPNTKLLVCTHISNVTGTVNDIYSIGSFCREQGILFLVDAAQSAGVKLIDVQKMCVDLLAFPGHKGLLGPQGTGGLYIRQGLEVNTIIEGGTGSSSEQLSQPRSMPWKFESGTLNTPGLAGLGAGIQFVLEKGIEQIEKREVFLVNELIHGIKSINGVCMFGPEPGQNRASVVSIYIDNMSPAEAALMMDTAFNIAVRSGHHCASDAHRAIGTLDRGGTIRISPNYFNSEEDIKAFLTALEHCTRS